MITEDGKISTDLFKIDKSKVVTDAATDGVTKVILYAETKRALTFSVPADFVTGTPGRTLDLKKSEEIALNSSQ